MFEPDASKAVAKLVRDYGERAFQFAYRLTGNIEESRDLVQEAYRRVLANWDKYDARQPVENWFFTILRHLFLDAVRHYERSHVFSMDAPAQGSRDESAALLADRLPDGEDSVETVLERREGSELVQQALKRLSLGHRAALTLCDMEGLGYDEIAGILDCPVGTVRSRISRARAELRGLLAQYMKEPGIRG